jgi:hypothetical protein
VSSFSTINTPGVEPPTAIGESQKHDFLRIEYQESAKAYALGVQAGQDFMRQFLYGNGLLAAFFGATISFSSRVDHPAIKWVLIATPILAILASAILLFTMPHWLRLLHSCLQRCVEIERSFDGKLFTDIARISKEGRYTGATLGLIFIYAIFVIFWLVMLFAQLKF